MNQTLSGSLQIGSGLSFIGVNTPSGAMPMTQPPEASKMSGALLALISSRRRVVAGPPRMVMKSKSIPVDCLKAAASLVASSLLIKEPYIVTLPSFLPASRIVCQAALVAPAPGAPPAEAGAAPGAAADEPPDAAGVVGGAELQPITVSRANPTVSPRITLSRPIGPASCCR